MHRIFFILLLITSCATATVKLDEAIIKLDDETKVIEIGNEGELEGYRIIANISGVSSKQTSVVISNNDGKIYSYFIGPGDVNLKINSDWYDKEGYIKVLGVNGNIGELKIEYKIY